MLKEDLAVPVNGGGGALYWVTAPYAGPTITSPYEVLAESYFDGAIAFSTALELHRLTDQRSHQLHVLTTSYGEQTVRPMDASLLEWERFDASDLPRPIRLKQIEEWSVHSHHTKPEWFFGTETLRPEGYALRVTDLERSLLDGLRTPKYCGGLSEVFRAWVRAIPLLDLDRLVLYVEKFDSDILAQRTGYVLETLEISHPRLTIWRNERAHKGGSRLLDPEKPFGGRYSEAWKLSLNHSTDILETRDVSYS